MAVKTTTKDEDDQPRRHVDRGQENEQGRADHRRQRGGTSKRRSPSPGRPAVPRRAAAKRRAGSGAADER